jgi:hypothetical protein
MGGYSGLAKAETTLVLAVPLLMTGPVPRPVFADGLLSVSGSFYTPKSSNPLGGSTSAPGWQDEAGEREWEGQHALFTGEARGY